MSCCKTTTPVSSVRRIFDQIAARRLLAIALTALVAFTVAAIFTWVRVPAPKVHDEFSYLLAADTFTQGRLTNPSPTMWEHLETFHVIQQPSYASKYQPGQGLILALGTIAGGHPIVGAWLATALAAAAVCWMLQGWVPNRWALLGGLLVALHGMIQVRWSLSYWGGSLPMAGGALMFGALPRIQRQPLAATSMLMALGAILLAATRPFEGFIVGICVTFALLLWMFSKRRPNWPAVIFQVVLPAAGVLLIGIAALGYYNLQVTGDPLRMPYQIHESEYAYSPAFIWSSTYEQPEYRHKVMRDFYTGWAVEDYQKQQTLAGWWTIKSAGMKKIGRFFLSGALWLPLLMLPAMLVQRRLRFVWIAGAIFLAAELSVSWIYPHYFAPAVPLLFLLVIQGLRHLNALQRRGHEWGRFVVPAIILLQVASLLVLFAQYVAWEPEGWQWQRAQIAEQLENTPGEHLVLVNYGPEHSGHNEWVYNRADLDNAKVVWARSMNAEKDNRLKKHFSDRHVWLIDADAEQPKLTSSPASL